MARGGDPLVYLNEPDPVVRSVLRAADDMAATLWEPDWMKRLARLVGNELR
jgi:hypothetical protein